MSDLTLTALRHGPFKLEGQVRLINSAGQEVVQAKPTIFLCRCGLSKNKPFCDGSHKAANFEGGEPDTLAAEAAAQAASTA